MRAQSGSVPEATLTLKEAAERVGVAPSTLKRWADAGVIPEVARRGTWTPSAVSHARVVMRLRERGHRLDQIREASEQGRLAHGYIESLFAAEESGHTLKGVASETGLEPALVERFWVGMGLPSAALDSLRDEDVDALRYVAVGARLGLSAGRVSPALPRLRSRARRRSPTPRCASFTSTCTSR